jgi:hypothetical protein
MSAAVFECLVCLFGLGALLSMSSFGLFVYGFGASACFFEPRCEMFSPSIGV